MKNATAYLTRNAAGFGQVKADYEAVRETVDRERHTQKSEATQSHKEEKRTTTEKRDKGI